MGIGESLRRNFLCLDTLLFLLYPFNISEYLKVPTFQSCGIWNSDKIAPNFSFCLTFASSPSLIPTSTIFNLSSLYLSPFLSVPPSSSGPFLSSLLLRPNFEARYNHPFFSVENSNPLRLYLRSSANLSGCSCELETSPAAGGGKAETSQVLIFKPLFCTSLNVYS